MTETLEQHGLPLVAITKFLHDQKAQTAITNERLERIVELLTPEEGEKASGPGLAEVLMELAAKIDRQNALVKDLTELTVQGLTELPQAVAEAILEAEADAASGGGAGAGDVMNLRKISAKADGRLIRAYLTEHTALTPPMPEEHQGKALVNYYGHDARATWRADMAPEVAAALGSDPTAAPTEQALDRLFEAKRADTGQAWSQAARDVSAVDFVTSVEKNVSLAITFAKSDEERAALLQAVWRANDRAMRHVGRELGWARRGDGGQDGAEPGQVGWVSFMHFQARPTHALQDGPDGQTYVMDVAVPGDPQVHIHNPMFNLVVTEGGHVGSLDTAEMHGRVKEFGTTFQ